MELNEHARIRTQCVLDDVREQLWVRSASRSESICPYPLPVRLSVSVSVSGEDVAGEKGEYFPGEREDWRTEGSEVLCCLRCFCKWCAFSRLVTGSQGDAGSAVVCVVALRIPCNKL